MVKTAVIGDENAFSFQKAINAFIKDKKVVDIKYQTLLIPRSYTNGIPNKMAIVDRALIIYEEEENNGSI